MGEHVRAVGRPNLTHGCAVQSLDYIAVHLTVDAQFLVIHYYQEIFKFLITKLVLACQAQ